MPRGYEGIWLGREPGIPRNFRIDGAIDTGIAWVVLSLPPPVAQKMRWLILAEWPPRSSSGLTTVVRSVQIYTELLTMGDVV
jgi:hypothetical protein